MPPSGSSHTIGDYHSTPVSSPLHTSSHAASNHAPISQSSTMPTLSTMMHGSSQPYTLPNSTSVNYSMVGHTSSYANPVSSYAPSSYVSSGGHQVTFANPVTAPLSNNISQISSTLAGIQSTLPGLTSGLSNSMGLTTSLQNQLSGNTLSGCLSNVQNPLSAGLTGTLTGMQSSLTGGIGTNLSNALSGLTGNTNLSGLSSNLSYGQSTYTNPLIGSGLSGSNAMNIKLKPLEEMELGAGRFGGGRAATPVTPHHQTSWGMEGLSGQFGLDGIGALNPGFVHSQTRPMSRMIPNVPGGLDMDGKSKKICNAYTRYS